MKISLPHLYVTDCKRLTIEKNAAAEFISIRFDEEIVIITVTGPSGMPELEVLAEERT